MISSLAELFDEDVQLQRKISPGSATQGPSFDPPRTVRAKIEMEGNILGTDESLVGLGRILLDTTDPPRIGDMLTLPAPYPRHPDITQVDVIKYRGQIHHVVIHCAR